MIYFIKASDRVKIGYASDPSLRIPAIQTSSPFELEVLLIIDGTYEKESELHGFDLTNFKINSRKDQIYRNCVHPETGLHILNCAIGKIKTEQALKQNTLF